MTATFTTADRLNTPEPEATQEEVLAESMRIVRGETMMLATKKHLVALAELNDKLLKAVKVAQKFFINPGSFNPLSVEHVYEDAIRSAEPKELPHA
jgi:hypothetical protein